MPALTLLHSIHFASPEPTCKEGTVVCPACSVGCRLSAVVEHNAVVRIAADSEEAPSHGRFCPRSDVLASDQRLALNRVKHPMIRRHRGEGLSRVSWDQALTFVADELQRVQIAHGRDAIGWIGDGRLDTESAYLFNKFFKGFLGTNHVDGCTPVTAEATGQAMDRAFGAAGSTACFSDLLATDVTIILGSDVTVSHPVLGQMITQRRMQAPNSRVVVLDSRRTATAQLADVHVQLNGGSEAAFLQLVAKRLMAIGRVDDRFIRRSVEGFADYRVELESLDEGALLAATGVHPGRVDEVVDFLEGEVRLVTLFNVDGPGAANATGTANATGEGASTAITAAANLHIQLGQVGHDGAGLLALSSQSNAMGITEAGATPGGLPGGRCVTESRVRDRLEVKWGVPAQSIVPMPGMTAARMLEAAARGELALLWISGSLESFGEAEQELIRRAMRGCQRVIVQDAAGDSEVAVLADVLLPTSVALEKAGTMTNAERLVVRSPQLAEPPGEAKPDWWVAARTAQLMGFEGFDYANAEAVWDEYRKLTEGTPCDQSGMTNQRLDDRPLQWPCPDERHVGTVRRFMSGRFPTTTGKAHLTAR